MNKKEENRDKKIPGNGFLYLGLFSQRPLPPRLLFVSPQMFHLPCLPWLLWICVSVNVTSIEKALACDREGSIKEIESTTSPHTPGIVHLPPLAVGGTFSIVSSICPPISKNSSFCRFTMHDFHLMQ